MIGSRRGITRLGMEMASFARKLQLYSVRKEKRCRGRQECVYTAPKNTPRKMPHDPGSGCRSCLQTAPLANGTTLERRQTNAAGDTYPQRPSAACIGGTESMELSRYFPFLGSLSHALDRDCRVRFDGQEQ